MMNIDPMNTPVLYIVGNGFDIYHGIPSRYSDFKGFMREHARDAHDHVEEYLQAEENWSDLESALATLDYDTILDQALDFLQPYSAEKWSDAYHHDYQYEIDNIVSSLSTKLKNNFCAWLRQLQIHNNASSHINLDRCGIFLNFNYTPSLQNIYDVPEDNILFIHGKSWGADSEIILGHAWDPATIPNLNDVQAPEDLDTRIYEGNEIINAYFRRTFKPTVEIINNNKVFFESLQSIREIHVLGHSLSDVDFKYIEEVSRNVNRDAAWKVSFHNHYDIENHKKVMSRLNVREVEYRELRSM